MSWSKTHQFLAVIVLAFAIVAAVALVKAPSNQFFKAFEMAIDLGKYVVGTVLAVGVAKEGQKSASRFSENKYVKSNGKETTG